MVNKKVLYGTEGKPRSEIAQAIHDLRLRLNCTQRQLAELLGVSQSQVPKWESDTLKPTGQVFARLADYASADQKAWWLELAGVKTRTPELEERMRKIPVLRDSAAAGTSRSVDEKEIDYTLLFPPELLPLGGKLVAFKVEGDSMQPVLQTGFIVLVDTAQRDVAKLAGKMVAARDEDGLTIKWLRKQTKMYLLVPQNTALRHEVRVITEGEDVSIVGEVVMWIGRPYVDKKRR